jgi:hypothetical protein
MRVDIVTLFPEMVETLLRFGVTGRAVERGSVAGGKPGIHAIRPMIAIARWMTGLTAADREW